MVQSALVGILFVLVFSGADGTQTMRVIMMKVNLLKWCVFVVVVLAGRQTAVFAEDGAPSDSTLSQMGLSGLAIMSDDEAMDVRGEGFGSGGSSASAWGSSFANIETPFGSAGSENGYSAHGKHEADGSNLSFAGVEITSSGGNDGHHSKPPKDGGMGNDNKGSKGHGKDMGGDKGGYGGKGSDKGGNGSYGGGDKSGKGHGSNGNGGDKGGYGGNGGSKGHGKDGGGGYGGGGKDGNKGGGSKSVSFVVFAGGSSRAHAK
jgi:hypothetical protein